MRATLPLRLRGQPTHRRNPSAEPKRVLRGSEAAPWV